MLTGFGFVCVLTCVGRVGVEPPITYERFSERTKSISLAFSGEGMQRMMALADGSGC